MVLGRSLLTCAAALVSLGCAGMQADNTWQAAVDRQASQLGYRNWIVIAEASFPAHNRAGLRQVSTDLEVPEALDYVLNVLEKSENVRPNVYVTREARAVENDFAPGMDDYRKRIKSAFHGHETTELEQQSLLTLLENANKNFDVLVVRTTSALPYTSIFLELQPGYWDVDSETRLREKIARERIEKIARPF